MSHPVTTPNHDELKTRLHRRLIDSLDLMQARTMALDDLRRECMRRVDQLLTDERVPLTSNEKQVLIGEVLDEMFGLGPLEDLMRDATVTDVLVNGPQQVYVERSGLLTLSDVTFRDNEHLLTVIQRIAANVGRRIDESAPMLDARLTDGSRVNAIIPPLALQGPVMSIRRFSGMAIDAERLVELGAWTRPMCEFLQAAVHCKANIIVSGGTGTGKTTLLNSLSRWIPDGERVITIEDAAELQLQREHVVSLETRPANIEGQGLVTQRDLVKNTLRMRPDRIILGEVRGGEAVDMLNAMNTGHEGSMSTVHANTARDALRRLENMFSMAGMSLPVHVVRDQLASALDLIIQTSRMTGGRRRIVSITEVVGIEGDVILVQDIFRFVQKGVDADGHAYGDFETCGVRPRLLDRLLAEGMDVAPDLFVRRVMG